MGDKSVSTSPYGQILKMSELSHASNLDPITTKMVWLEDILPSNKPPPPMHDSSVNGTDAGTFMDNHTACWTPSENKMFEVALAQVDEHDPQRWEKIAAWVPEKTVAQVKEHYLCLVEDIENIHSGWIPIPCYVDEDLERKKVMGEGKKNGNEKAGKKKEKETALLEKPSEEKTVKERRRGVPWTEEEHWWFLFGLSNYGKGDWRGIAKRFVPTRTTTQVASHAQKFFKRPFKLAKQNGDKRKGSIHDIRSIKDSKAFSAPHVNSGINPWPFLSPMHKHQLLEQLVNAPGNSSAQGSLLAFLPKPQARLLNQTMTGLGRYSPNIIGGNSMNNPSNCFGSFPSDNLSGSSMNSALESLNNEPGNFPINNSTSWLRNYQGDNLSNGFPGFHPTNISFMSSNSPSSYFDGQPSSNSGVFSNSPNSNLDTQHSSYSGVFSNSHNSNLDDQPSSYSRVFSNSHNSNLDGQPSSYSGVFSNSHNSNLDGQHSSYRRVFSNSHNRNLDGQPSSYSGAFSNSHNSNLDGQFGWPANSLTGNLSIGFGEKMLNNVSGAWNLSGGGFENFPSTNLNDAPGNSMLPLNDANGWAEKYPSNSLMGEFGYHLPSNSMGDAGNYRPSNLTGEFASSNEMEEFVNFPPYNSEAGPSYGPYPF